MLIFRNTSMTSTLVCGSRFPVGSSAKIISGSFSKALAMAIRCCSPPDNWCGILFAKFFIPTFSKTSSILSCISCLSVQPVAFKTNTIFSFTFRSGSNLKSWKTIPILRLKYGIFFSFSAARS
ncbi:hypothetical protein D9M68_325780 [compost metagenome]